MKVCILTTSFPRFKEDSAGIFIYNLSCWLSKRGIKIEIISPHDYGCKYSETWDGIRIHRFPYFYPHRYQRLCYRAGILQNIKRDILAMIQLPPFIIAQILYSLWIIKKGNFDVIHAHWLLPQGLIGIFCKGIFKIPCITTIHGSDIYGFKSPWLKALNAKVIKYSDICTANSKATARAARKICERKNVEIIPMGVEHINLFGKSSNAGIMRRALGINGRVVLFIGRLIDLKGVDYLIKALPHVLQRCPDIKVLLVGSGPQKEYLVKLSKDLGLGNSVFFLDKVPPEETLKFYSLASLFVLPSIVNERGETEGLGIVLLEAMASGVPVIGSNVGGIPDIIKDGETGLLARQKDHNDLAKKMIRLLTDEELRNKLIENGFESIKEGFSWEVISDRFIKIYQEVTRRRNGHFNNIVSKLTSYKHE
ncbi:MAG: glycosyltransferase family 4 protein [Deltaproteobacteria bacterium]|nr:glycosyltransferase family 4 protein [Deltaproteobacteria bacterium]MBW2074145.1 glycosyltransferase family 4 protein [Deltaproteobacteria bacterium]